MICYKLTDEKDQTYNGMQWGPGVSHETDGVGELCGPGWLHYYDDPLLAVFLNPAHGNFDPETMHLWECLPEGIIREDKGVKFGCTKLTTLEKISLPKVSMTQKITFGILCAVEVYDKWEYFDKGKIWRSWANEWLSGNTSADMCCASDVYNAICVASSIDHRNTNTTHNINSYVAHDNTRYAAWSAYSVIHALNNDSSYAVSRAADYATRAAVINLKAIAKKAMEF
jgi:hypothetical protein